MSNENSSVLGPAFNATPKPATSKPEARDGICSFVEEVKDLPVGKYAKGDTFTVVVDRISGDVHLVKQHPSNVPVTFAVTPPPKENQVVVND